MPNDDGNLFLTDEGRSAVLSEEPSLATVITPFLGAKEFINGLSRWCYWLPSADPRLIRQSNILKQVGKRMVAYREASSRTATKLLAEKPFVFGEIRQPNSTYLLIPRHSSENRQYVPIGFVEPEIIVGDSCMFVPNATLYHFGVLTSAMHMAWMRYTCGRLESRYRYSKDIVYNNFPWPTAPAPEAREAIEAAAQAVLDARAAHPGSTLADLYDPLAMPPDLRAAHHRLDKLIDHLYQRKAFRHDTERVQRLFEKYDELNSPLAPAAPAPRPRRPRPA